MQCGDVRTLLIDGADVTPDGRAHLAGCAECRAYAQRAARLDDLLRPALLAQPPVELQASLAALVRTAVAPAPEQAPKRWRVSDWVWLPRTPMGVAQGLAVLSTALASWQVLGWLGGASPVVGDIPYALGLVLASPAVRDLGELPVDLPGLATWSAVALAGWALSESGPIGRARALRS